LFEVLVLGTAAGGGFPQWNCSCPNCRLAREGTLSSRTQSSLAVSANGRDWHLVNASPDVALQLERFVRPRLNSRASTEARLSPIRSVFLTNADLDHTLGLLQLREGTGLDVTAPASVRSSLERGLSLSAVLGAYGGIRWHDASSDWHPADDHGLEVRAIPLPGGPPRYDAAAGGNDHGVGYLFRAGGAIAGIFPDVGRIDAGLRAILAECSQVWIDGTFWSDDEMLSLSGRTSLQMGHLPLSGPDGSLKALKGLEGRAAYLHINNTNPILRPDSAERIAVAAAGFRVAEDGEHAIVNLL
jgi:pyrroloquinoline quinone biosynthesis protein B